MTNRRFSDAQIMAVSKQTESGVPVSAPCREHGMSMQNDLLKEVLGKRH